MYHVSILPVSTLQWPHITHARSCTYPDWTCTLVQPGEGSTSCGTPSCGLSIQFRAWAIGANAGTNTGACTNAGTNAIANGPSLELNGSTVGAVETVGEDGKLAAVARTARMREGCGGPGLSWRQPILCALAFLRMWRLWFAQVLFTKQEQIVEDATIRNTGSGDTCCICLEPMLPGHVVLHCQFVPSLELNGST